MNQSRRIKVRDVMKTAYQTIDGLSTIHDALKLIKSERTSVLVVNKRDEHDEFGVLLVSDIARHVLALDRSPKRVNVYEVMEKPAIYVSPDMDIRYCSRLFARYDLVRALVVEGGEVIGTVSPNSLVLDGLAELEGLQ
jgi:predicted transcriptional regulator